MSVPIDYEILRLIWWLLLGVLLIGFAILDGFDLGVATLLPFVAKNDTEKRILINTVGPVWEGNQVWFVLGGGAVFAAWPALYALSFSGFYLAMYVILFTIILRPVGFKFRSKMEGTKWRAFWDACLFLGGFVPTLICGVAIGNTLQGVPFSFDEWLRSTYHGTFFGLLNPFALLCGVVSVLMCIRHGAIYLSFKVDSPIKERLQKVVFHSTILFIVLVVIAGFWLSYLPFYKITSVLDHNGPSNPLYKAVCITTDSFLNNFRLYPWMILAPVFCVFGAILSLIFFKREKSGLSFIFSSLSIAGTIGQVGCYLFPIILPSSSHPSHSLTVFDASSSQLTLFIMTIAAVIFVPIVISYTSWLYKIMAGKLTNETIDDNSKEMY
jgi:cytochrome d ubiquinol oxidase subunit II